MSKIIKTNKEAREALKRGVDAVADAVKITIGPRGRNVVLDKEYSEPVITNDGVSIAKEIELDDEIENLGARVMKDVAKKTNDKAGDGTTTATILAQATIDLGYKRLDDGGFQKLTESQTQSPMLIRKELNEAKEEIIKELKALAKPVKTKEDMINVASVSMESKEIGEIIGSTFYQVGKEGVVTVEESDGSEIETSVVKGIEIDRGFVSPFMANDREECKMSNPYILVTNQDITSVKQLIPIIQKLSEQKIHELVIIANSFDNGTISTLVLNKVNGIFNTLAVTAPSIHKEEYLEDIAVVTGAKVIDKVLSMKIEDVTIEDLGRCEKVTSTKEKTMFVDGAGDTKEFIKQLKAKKFDAKFDEERNQKRIARLSGGVGVIRVGANSQSERTYLKLKVDDAVNATKAAIEEGIVPGGGLALLQIAKKLPNNILSEVIVAPYNQIIENAGEELEITEDIIDPVKVTRIALENAVSLAGILLTTEVAVAIKEEKKDD